MGQCTTRIPRQELKHLEETTYFDAYELEQWHKDFVRDCPNGQLNRYEFASIYAQFFPYGDATRFASYVFNVFDENGDGHISFAEFITALSITSRGTLEEKLEWAFSLYDVDGDGYITQDEMLDIVDSIYMMVGPDGSGVLVPADMEETPETRVARIFAHMDLASPAAPCDINLIHGWDNDGRLTRTEFKEGARTDPLIVEALSICFRKTYNL